MKKCILILLNESETVLLGSIISKVCMIGCVIYLRGCIGTGKSVFCRSFLRALGYMDSIKSPTYTVIESYFVSNKYLVHHLDFYRLNSVEEFMYMGIRDYLYGENICLIEWPDRIKDILPIPDVLVTINYHNSEKSRKVILESFSKQGQVIVSTVFQSGIFIYI